MYMIGKINKELYKCITKNIITDEVIITDNQIQHIKERHSDSFKKALKNINATIEKPDYIIADDKHKDTGLVIKNIENEKEHLQLVLRVCTSQENFGYKNSIISCWIISERRLQNYLRNKRILYRKE